MDSRDAIKLNIEMAAMVCKSYLEDLTDEEMMQRPHAGCNHINWQVGHLIATEHSMIESVAPGSMPALPEGFADKYSKDTAGNNDAAAFAPKAELMSVAAEQRAGTMAKLAKATDADLIAEAPEPMRGFAPNVAAIYSMQGSHWMMHAGQWVILRRELGRAIIM